MKKITNVLLALVVFALGACSSLKPGCLIVDRVSPVFADVISSKLECEDPTAVRADVRGFLAETGLCQTGAIADAVCPIAVSATVNFVFREGIPSKWKCKATAAKSVIKSALEGACKRIPVKSEYQCR